MDLATLADVKSVAEVTGSSSDDLIQVYLTAVSKRVETFLDREFASQTHTEVHHGGFSRIYVKNPPVSSITSIIWDEFGQFSQGFTFTNSDYYLVNENWDIAYSSGIWPGGKNALQVTYTSGFEPPTASGTLLPKDLQLAVAQQTAYEFKRRKDIGMLDVSFPDGSIQKQADQRFLNVVREALEFYRVPKNG